MSLDAYQVAILALLKACQDGHPQHELVVPFCATLKDKGVVVVSLEWKGAERIVIPVHPRKQVGRSAEVNLIASIYGKRADVEAKWRATGLLLWEPTHAIVRPHK